MNINKSIVAKFTTTLVTKTALIIAMLLPLNNALAGHHKSSLNIQPSSHSVNDTVAKLSMIIKDKDLNIFTTIDHQLNAKNAGLTMKGSQVIIFGNPKIGSQLMNCSATSAIDLPLKFLVYEDNDGQVNIAYNEMKHLKKRHGIEGCDEVIEKVTGALANMSKAAAN